MSLLPPKPLHSRSAAGAAPCTPHSRRTRFPAAEFQMSHSIKPLIPGAVTQEQPELVPPRRTSQEPPRAFIPFIFSPSLRRQASFFGSRPLSVSVTSLASPASFVNQKIGDSRLLLCLSVSIHLAGVPHPHAFVIPRVGTSRPLVSGSHPQLHLHLNLQFASRATWSSSIPQQQSAWISGILGLNKLCREHKISLTSKGCRTKLWRVQKFVFRNPVWVPPGINVQQLSSSSNFLTPRSICIC